MQYEGYFVQRINQQSSGNMRRTFLEKYKKFPQSGFFYLFVCFSGFGSYLLKYKKVCNLEARMFHFLIYKAFLREGFFIF